MITYLICMLSRDFVVHVMACRLSMSMTQSNPAMSRDNSHVVLSCSFIYLDVPGVLSLFLSKKQRDLARDNINIYVVKTVDNINDFLLLDALAAHR